MIFTLIRIRGWGCLILGDFFSEMRKFFNFCLDNRKQKWYNTKALRGVAQFGRALGSGPRGRKFKSSHSDHNVEAKKMSPAKSLSMSGFFCYPKGDFSLYQNTDVKSPFFLCSRTISSKKRKRKIITGIECAASN